MGHIFSDACGQGFSSLKLSLFSKSRTQDLKEMWHLGQSHATSSQVSVISASELPEDLQGVVVTLALAIRERLPSFNS